MEATMKTKSVGVNAVLNTIKQLCAIVFPLITFPYISRVLQVENYGKVNFGSSIISYFALFAALGISNYAIREGARIRKDKIKFRSFANEVFTINVISTVVSYILLLLLVLLWGKLHSYWNLLLVQSLSIALTTLGADWINSIYEDYFYITVRYILFQILSIILMLTLVKTPQDYVLYSAISVVSSAGANLSNIIHIRKYTHLKITFHPNLKKHLKPMMILFCNSLSVQIYVNSDVTMLGAMQSDTAVGIYSAAVKVYNIVKNLLNAIVVVTIPRISALLGENKINEYNELLDKTFHSIITLIMPAITGIFMLSFEIIYIIGGERYASGYWALRILCIGLAGATFANFFNNAILVPNKKEKNFLEGTVVAAVVNVALNFCLIPFFSYLGAAITTLIAEFIVLIFGIHFSKGLYFFKFSKRDIGSCVVGCLIISVVCIVMRFFDFSIYVYVLTCILLSITFYAITLIIFRNRFAISIISTLKSKIKS